MKPKLKLSVLLAIEFAVFGPAHAQTTAFTYNGRLTDNGAPVNGNYEFRFTIYDTEGGAGVVVGPLPVPSVDVANGLFTVRLDFGADIFTGPARWLEVSVRRGGSANFEILSPRQELTSSPYAIRAANAGTASDVANGSVVKSLNSLRDNVTLAAGANVTLTPSGNTLTIASTGGGGGGIWSLNGANAYYNGGSVGVGTDSPVTRFTVAGAGVYNSPTAAAIMLDNTAAGRRWEWHALDDGRLQLADFTLATTRLMIDTAGNLGLGTSTPNHRLSIAGSPAWTANGWGGAVELENASAIGWRANAAGQRFGMGHSGGGFFLFRTASDPGTAGSAASYDFVVNDAGNVGIGTTDPEERLTIANVFGPSSGLKITGVGVAGVGMAIENLIPGGHKWDLVSGDVFNPLVPSLAGNFRIVDETANATRLVIAPDGNVGIGNLGNPQAKLDVQGTTRTTVLTITGGADLAEPFPISSANLTQGSVVVIDDEQPGKLKLSARAYDTRVAGVVSGANGVNPGISLRQEGTLEGSQNVSLTGRVYVLADATTDSIKAGDLLTTSDTPGHAMKVTDSRKAQGAILGKAMGGLKEGKGMVLILVTLQ